MKAEITAFPSLYTTSGRRVATNWPAVFAKMGRPLSRARKEHVPGWAPCIYERDSRAEDCRALAVTALVCEYDHDVGLDAAAETWGDWFGFVYSTFSHKPDAPRLRVILPLSRNVTPEEHGRLWRWAESVGGAIDRKAKDAKRFWFWPAIAPGGVYETRNLCGAILEPDPVLAEVKPIASPPAPIPTRIGFADRTHVYDRASRYLRAMPPAISGSGGHLATFRAAVALVRGFGLPEQEALSLLMRDFNPRCQPPWSERELRHKITSAAKQSTRPLRYLDRERGAA